MVRPPLIRSITRPLITRPSRNDCSISFQTRIRSALLAHGIVLKDSATGTTWEAAS